MSASHLIRPLLALSGVLVCTTLAVADGARAPRRAPDADLHSQPPLVTVGPVEVLAPEPGGQRGLALDFMTVNVPPEGDAPTELAFTPDGTRIVIAHRDSQNLVVVDALTRQVLQVIPLSGSPNSLALTPDGATAVTANLFEDTISVVDLASGVETQTLLVGDQPGIVRITPDGSRAVVGVTLESAFAVIDLATLTEVNRLTGVPFWLVTSFGAWAISYRFTDFEICPDNATIVFPDNFANQVYFFDIVTGSSVTAPTEPKPFAVDVSPDGLTAVIAHSYPETKLSVVDVPGRTVTKFIPLGGSGTSPTAVAINPSRTKAVTAIQNAVKVVNLVTNAVSPALNTGTPNLLLTSADGQYCVVGNYLGNIISYATETIVAAPLNTTTPDWLAVSPVNARAATAHILRKEHAEIFTTSGASSVLEGVIPTGVAPEGDKARNVALSADGQRLVAINNHSWNATIFDTQTRSIVGVAPVGERPGEVALTPDGTTAVVANLDAPFASIIDLATATTTNVNISRRGSQVAVAPDGLYAYIPVVADGDGVWRINLSTLSVAGPKLATGNMGGIGYMFDLSSGMTLSHDGATLVTCGSFDNNISIIDTATWTEVKRLTVGTFPVRAVFSPDDNRIYVSNKNSNNVSVVSNAGAGSAVLATTAVGTLPFELAVNHAGTRLYIANFQSKSISVMSLSTNTIVGTIPLPATGGAGEPAGLHVSADDTRLFVVCNGADFHEIDLATNALVNTVNTGLAPADFVYCDASRRGYIASPYGGDGVTIVSQVLVGDLDCDGDVDFGDINPFVLRLSNPAAYAAAYPFCPEANADIDGSGAVDFGDINPFVALLSSP